MNLYTFQSLLRLRNNGTSPASWHFITVPQDISESIKQDVSELPRKGWGSVRVDVRIGFYSRKTSIFPDTRSGCYLLPVKADARKALQINEGDEVSIQLTVLDVGT